MRINLFLKLFNTLPYSVWVRFDLIDNKHHEQNNKNNKTAHLDPKIAQLWLVLGSIPTELFPLQASQKKTI